MANLSGSMHFAQVCCTRRGFADTDCLGNIMTPMVRKNFEDDPGLREIWERENMFGRLSEPSEYRGAALFLLSDASSFMTGSQVGTPRRRRYG